MGGSGSRLAWMVHGSNFSHVVEAGTLGVIVSIVPAQQLPTLRPICPLSKPPLQSEKLL